jgi:hypothetical protein
MSTFIILFVYQDSRAISTLLPFIHRIGLPTCCCVSPTTFLQNQHGAKMRNNVAFPHRELSNVIDPPANASLQVPMSQLCDNASSVPSRRGGRAHGHLRIVMDTVTFMTVSKNIPWVDPVHPGVLPLHGTGVTAILHRQINP